MEFYLSCFVRRVYHPLLIFLMVGSLAGQGWPLWTLTVKNAFAADSTDALPYIIDNSMLSEGKLVASAQHGSFGNIFTNFQPWGQSTLQIVQPKDNAPITVSGSTGSDSAGFTAKGLDQHTRLISFSLESIAKSRDSQVSFSFLVSDGTANYTILLVNGPLSSSGWKDSTYYDRLVPGSPTTYDMDKIFDIQGISVWLKQITIVVQKNTNVKAEFRANIISPEQYGVAILHADSILYNGIIIHDLQVARSVVLQFDSLPSNYTIVYNGWQSANFDAGHRTLAAFEPVQQSPFESLAKVDLWESLSHLGAKDLLFAAVTGVAASGLVLFPFREPGRKAA